MNESDVCRSFRGLNVHKASGPDKICGNVLRSCCYELAGIFTTLFNLSLRQSNIPTTWKTAETIPVPKKPMFIDMNNLRSVALTPIIMKFFERLVLKLLKRELEVQLDPLQFAYKTKRGVEDAVLVFVNNALKHMKSPKTFVRILFIDFSSAFNTIQPHIMVEKLLSLSVNKNLIAWNLDFLTNRTQYVKLNETISNLCKVNTGAPQSCVPSPTLYTLYTNDYRVKHSDTSLIKFADDSAFQGLFTNGLDSNYIEEVYRFVKWCEENYLILNVSKTKEMIIDFRRQKSTPTPLVINNETVEIVHTYKYLGFTVDDKLNWHEHCNELIKKINKRMYFLRKLKSFRLNNEVLYTFYCSILGSVITFGISCWGSSITAGDRKILNSTIKKKQAK